MTNARLAAILLIATCATLTARAEDLPVPEIGDFDEVTEGQYQVFCQSGRALGSQVNQFMNIMLRQYSRYFSNWSPKAGARVVVFDNAEDFRNYSRAAMGHSHSGLAGYCLLKTDEAGNTFYELVTYVHDNLWQVLAHEGFHQFIGYELGLEIPVWLNEGMAQYFETSQLDGSRLRTGLVSPVKLRAAQNLIRRRQMPALSDLIAMDRATFYGNPQATYPASWALVYYLMTHDGTSFTNSRFRRYLQDIKFSRNDIASFQRRFGRDSAQWQADFQQFILSQRPPAE